MSHDYDENNWERSYDYDPRYPASRVVSYNQSRPQTSFSDGRREIVTQDMALPSIEPPVDVPDEAPGRVVSHGSPRYSKVRYQEVDDGRHPPPPRSNVTYVDGWEKESEAKRRRMVVANDPSLIPISMGKSDSYFRLIPTSKMDHPSLMAPSFRRAADTRDIKGHTDMVPINENRLNHPGYVQHAVNSRDRDNITYMVDSRDYVGDERERRFIIDDDSPPMMRVVRRTYRPNETYSSGQHASEPEMYKIHRVEDQDYYKPRNSTLSIHASSQESVRPADPTQSARPVFLTRAPPSYQQRVATEISSHNSSFRNHSRSREMNSGQIFHQFPTSSDEPASRFSSIRNQPIMVDSISSQPLPQERHAVDNFQTIR
jgi:hypothetical protein